MNFEALKSSLSWLIGQGEEIYNKVMNNPEYLAEYISEDNLDDGGFSK